MTDKEKALMEDWENDIKHEICDVNDETLYPDAMRGRNDAYNKALESKDRVFGKYNEYETSVCVDLWWDKMENFAREVCFNYSAKKTSLDYWYGQ